LRAEIKRRGLNLERFLEPPKQIEAVAKEPEHAWADTTTPHGKLPASRSAVSQS
jgi:hypothetical protein